MTSAANSNLISHLRNSTVLYRSTLILSLAAGLVLNASPARAVDDLELPTGGNVVGGSANINYGAPGQLNVQQNSDRLVVDWNSFNIGKDATTTFVQPGSSALAVNRVTGAGQDPTQILGTLKANGRVMVLDRNGVIFGRTARVDVGGIIASTGNVDTSAVMSGSDRLALTDMGSGTVENQGTISVADGGLAALVAPEVRNSGVINARVGRVALAAGEAATVDLYGDNLIELQLDAQASKAIAENSGTINAEGGVVQITAQAAKNAVDSVVNMDGIVNASSVSEEGGRIVLGGDTVNVRGTLRANGTRGGSVTVHASSKAVVSGTIEAHGAAGTGFVETSAPDMEFASSASVTANGQWVIDPLNITIGPILEALLELQLNLFGDALVLTPAIGPQAGNITVERKIDWSTANTLTLSAINDIIFNQAVSGFNATGAGNVVLNAGRNVAITNGSGISTNGGNVTVNAQRFKLTAGSVNAHGGNISIANTAGFQALANSIVTSGTGQISLNQNKDASAFFSVNTIQNAVDAINNTGTGLNILNVGAGSYAENLLLDVANLRLNGANAGVAGYAARGAESSVTGAGTGISVTASNVAIDGVEVTGGTAGVVFNSVQDGVLRNSVVRNVSGVGVKGDNADTLLVSRNSVHNTGAEGIWLGNDSDAGEVSANDVYSTGSSGVYVDGGSEATLITGNTIGVNGSINGDGILVLDAKNYGSSVTRILGNTITGTLSPATNYGSGVHVRYSSQVFVGGAGAGEANTIYGTAWDGIRFHNGSDDKAIGNDISNVTRTGIFALDTLGLALTGNTVNGAGQYYGFDINNVKDATLDGNTILNTAREGVLLTNLYGLTQVTGNTVSLTGRDGIHALGTSNMQILGNFIGTLGAIQGDGILVENSLNPSSPSEISGNTITNTVSTGTDKGSGIQVLRSANMLIGNLSSHNIISSTGWDAIRLQDDTGITVEGNEGSGLARTGVYLGNVTSSSVRNNVFTNAGWRGVDAWQGSDLSVASNTVDTTGLEGINIEQVGGVVSVDGNGVNNTGGHGISVKSSPDVSITGNTVGGPAGYIHGIGIYANSPVSLTIGGPGAGNTVSTTDEEGIYVDAYGSGTVDITGNDVSDAGINGIKVRNVDSATLTGNTVNRAKEAGISIAGSHYGSSVLAGNEVTDADVGMLFETGLVDLTGATNKVTGGSVGYRFAPIPVKGGFGQVDLAGDTIGTTEFNGQSVFYVELLNGALFAPGMPTLEDGLNASYDGFVPNSVGGILTPLQYLALENMFYHYNDDPTVGLFFFGSSPDLQQNRIFRQDIDSFIPDPGAAGFTITGLPEIPGGGDFPTNPSDLNNLSPAAGGETPTADELAAIAPAAGGQNAPCWSDAVDLASSGQVANYNFSSDPLSALQDANACGANPNNL